MISICLATYNGEMYLQKQLDSIFLQLGENDELLISDDGSTDSTLNILIKNKTKNTQIFKNNFQNVVQNFEFLLHKSSKNIIVLCDQDDIWLSHKLKTIRNELDGDKQTCLQMNAEIINENGNKTGKNTFRKWQTRGGFWKNLQRNTFMGSSMAFTRDLLEVALPFPENIAMHDWWIGLITERIGTVKRLQEPTMLYRIHSFNASLGGSTAFDKLKWRLQMLTAIQKRLKNG